MGCWVIDAVDPVPRCPPGGPAPAVQLCQADQTNLLGWDVPDEVVVKAAPAKDQPLANGRSSKKPGGIVLQLLEGAVALRAGAPLAFAQQPAGVLASSQAARHVNLGVRIPPALEDLPYLTVLTRPEFVHVHHGSVARDATEGRGAAP